MDIYQMVVDVDTNQIIDDSSLKQNVKKREMIFYMEQCLLHLTQKQSKRVYKYYYQGKTKVSIAKEENVSEGAIRKSLNQSIYQLRRMMYLYLR